MCPWKTQRTANNAGFDVKTRQQRTEARTIYKGAGGKKRKEGASPRANDSIIGLLQKQDGQAQKQKHAFGAGSPARCRTRRARQQRPRQLVEEKELRSKISMVRNRHPAQPLLVGYGASQGPKMHLAWLAWGRDDTFDRVLAGKSATTTTTLVDTGRHWPALTSTDHSSLRHRCSKCRLRRKRGRGWRIACWLGLDKVFLTANVDKGAHDERKRGCIVEFGEKGRTPGAELDRQRMAVTPHPPFPFPGPGYKAVVMKWRATAERLHWNGRCGCGMAWPAV